MRRSRLTTNSAEAHKTSLKPNRSVGKTGNVDNHRCDFKLRQKNPGSSGRAIPDAPRGEWCESRDGDSRPNGYESKMVRVRSRHLVASHGQVRVLRDRRLELRKYRKSWRSLVRPKSCELWGVNGSFALSILSSNFSHATRANEQK